MGNLDVDAIIEGLSAQLEGEGKSMPGLSIENLRDALEHPEAAPSIAGILERESSAVKEGDPAPDFCLPMLRATGGDSPVRLSDHFKRRPVALIFGSYT